MSLDELKIYVIICLNQGFEMESQPQNPEFRKYPVNFHQCNVIINR